MSTSLKDLSSLHVDTVLVGGEVANFTSGTDHIALSALGGTVTSTNVIAGGSFASVAAAQAAAVAALKASGSAATVHDVYTAKVGNDTYVFSHEAANDHSGVIDSIIKLDNYSGTLSNSDFVAGAMHSSLRLDAGDLASFASGDLPHFMGAGGSDPDVTLNVANGDFTGISNFNTIVDKLHDAGVDHLDAANNSVTLTDSQADHLVHSGLDFAADDVIHVNAGTVGGGTEMSTTLKGLQDLHVSTVALGGDLSSLGAHIDAGASLAVVGAGSLPHFTGAGSHGVTLDMQDGNVAQYGDLSSIVGNLTGAGINHLDYIGAGGVSVDYSQVQTLAGHMDFSDPSDVSVNVASGAAATLNIAQLAQVHADHVDLDGAGHVGTATFSDAQALALIHAGIDFATEDNITVAAGGTHMSTTLKGLADLHVDTVLVGSEVGHFTSGTDHIALSALLIGGVTSTNVLAGGSFSDLASAQAAASTALRNSGSAASVHDVYTARVGNDTYVFSYEAANGHTGAIDSIIKLDNYSGTLTGSDFVGGAMHSSIRLDAGDLSSFSTADLPHFTGAGGSDPDVTLNIANGDFSGYSSSDFGSLVSHLHSAGIDHLDIGNNMATLTETQLHQVLSAGLDFAADDHIRMTADAHSTTLSTSLKGLHDLHVETVGVQAGLTALHLDAGDLHALSAGDLPHIDLALNVTLTVDPAQVSDLSRLASSLVTSGIDTIHFSQAYADFSSGDKALIDAMSSSHQFTFTYGSGGSTPMSAMSLMSFSDVMSSFESDSDTQATAHLTDGTASALALAEAGLLQAYTAQNVVVDGTASGDHLLTTLKDIADVGIDQIKLASQGSKPVYINLGVDHATAADITKLFSDLTGDGHGAGTGAIFDGAKVALVVDVDTANALSHNSGAMSHLASLGITEVDVLKPTGAAAPALVTTGGVEVKLIGQDDPLYSHLQHGH